VLRGTDPLNAVLLLAVDVGISADALAYLVFRSRESKLTLALPYPKTLQLLLLSTLTINVYVVDPVEPEPDELDGLVHL